MQKIKVSVKSLKQALLENREKHIADYKEAVEGWREATAKQLKANLKKVQSGSLDHPGSMLSNAPTSYEKSYDMAIKMCDMSADIEVELEQNEFQQYVMDEWQWKHSFVTGTAMYNNKAR